MKSSFLIFIATVLILGPIFLCGEASEHASPEQTEQVKNMVQQTSEISPWFTLALMAAPFVIGFFIFVKVLSE